MQLTPIFQVNNTKPNITQIIVKKTNMLPTLWSITFSLKWSVKPTHPEGWVGGKRLRQVLLK